uniref:CCHC-type domain-containing protein n=1 Tax=Lepisosteus oculatus TaxID=7918 RepID=W5NN09_LEPOC
MDPADQNSTTTFLQLQSQALLQLTSSVQRLVDHTTRPPPPPVAPVPVPPLAAAACPLPPPTPEKFEGDPAKLQNFLTQCWMAFHLRPDCFPSDREKIAFMVSHFSGRALDWATSLLARNLPVTADVNRFSAAMQSIFGQLHSHHIAISRLSSLTKGSLSFQDYAMEFHLLASQVPWNEEALIHQFCQGLSSAFQDHLTYLPLDFPSMEHLISRLAEIDIRLQEQRSRLLPPPATSRPTSFSSLSSEERRRRLSQGCCLYCGAAGHLRASCPLCPPCTSLP